MIACGVDDVSRFTTDDLEAAAMSHESGADLYGPRKYVS